MVITAVSGMEVPYAFTFVLRRSTSTSSTVLWAGESVNFEARMGICHRVDERMVRQGVNTPMHQRRGRTWLLSLTQSHGQASSLLDREHHVFLLLVLHSSSSWVHELGPN